MNYVDVRVISNFTVNNAIIRKYAYQKDEKYKLLFALFETSLMRETLQKYPEILILDRSYNVNIEGYILYSILCEDGCGRDRGVCYAFLQRETSAIVCSVFVKFIDCNLFTISAFKVIMIDKDLRKDTA